jgi:alpha-tubulin suppressor-like RCC1 family protein
MSLLKNLLSSTNKIGPPLNDYGSLYVWGINTSGKLGLNDLVHRSSPVLIDTSSWTQVVTRDDRAFAFKSDGSLWCWGDNTQGNLGLNDQVNRSSPVQIGEGIGLAYSWTSIASAGDWNLAIRSDSTLWGWGKNDAGQLGISNIADRSSPVQIGTSSWTAISVAHGINSAAAIRADGGLFTWGYNISGHLGQSHLAHRSSPVQIGTSSWTSVSVGQRHMAAIRSDGSLFTWGWNEYGQLGSNSRVHRSSPVQVGSSSWSQVGGAGFQTLAIRPDGGLFTWGLNDNGQLGLNDLVHRSNPVQVGVSSWSQVDSSTSTTMAVRSDGRLFAWGANTAGQLGQNDRVHRSSPVQIGTSSWISIGARNFSSFYAVRNDGTLWAWGSNEWGKLGISFAESNVTGRSSPVQIGTNTNWSKVSAGGSFQATVAAITNDGLLWMWGENSRGQLGQNDGIIPATGAVTSRSSPVQVGSLAWEKIAIGPSHTMAIKSDGSLWGWGYNFSNQVKPPLFTRIAKWTVLPNHISSLGINILALDEEYRLFSWGGGTAGVHGDNTITEKSSPVQIGTTAAYRVISGGNYASYAIRLDGSLWGWGAGDMIGYGDVFNRSSPVQIGTSSWTQVYGFDEGAFAIRSDGALFAWGNASDGGAVLGLGAVSTQAFSWTSVSSGLSSTIAIRSDGGLFAWGDASLYGTNGTTAEGDLHGDRASPVKIGTSSWTFATAAKNSNNMYAISSDGRLFAWGNATGGMLGTNDTVHRSSPIQIGSSLWTSVSAHTDSVAAIRSGGSLFVWGNNTTGELGLGLANNVILSSPVQVGTSSWTAVSVGLSNIAAIRSGGSLFTWGKNSNGELGNNASTTPAIFLTGAVSGNATGYNTFVINSDYKLWAIGENGSFTLGTNNTADQSSPVQIGTSSWTQVATTNGTGYMIRSDNTLWSIGTSIGDVGVHRSQPTQISANTWSEIMAEGNSTYSGGMVGVRTDGLMFAIPNGFTTTLGINYFNESPGFWPSFPSSSPVQIGTSSWSQVAASSGSIKAAIMSDGTLWGWGDNTFRTFKSTADTAFSWTTVATSVGALSDKISFGVRSDGSLWVWGSTTTRGGIFGLGGTANMLRSPNQIGTSSWTAVATDGRSALAIRNDGRLFAWGDNTNGQLGQNDRVHRSSPVQIGTLSWSQVSVATSSAYAIRTTGALFTWGGNSEGQLGSNTVAHRSSPVQVGTSSWVAISAAWDNTQGGGSGFAAAIRSGGSLFTWGNNSSGQLGSNTIARRSSPVQVGTSSWTAISSGNGHILALKGPQLWAWGLNDNGQLGSNSLTGRSSPIQIGTSSWIAVGGLNTASIAIRNDGRLFQWGTGNSGNETAASSPVQVGTSSWSQVYSGNTASARRSNNMLYQWGSASVGLYTPANIFGSTSPVQIGGIIPTYVESPTQISTSSWTQVAVGAYHIVALRTDGGLFTLGRNSSGELGLSDRVHRSSPVQIGTSSWTQIAAGHEGVLSDISGHSYAIRSDGGLFTWGHSDTGAGTNTAGVYRSAPTQIGSSSWTTISTHGDVGLGILNNGSLFVWGPNFAGNLGQNNQVTYSSPVQINSTGTVPWTVANSPIQIGTLSWTAVAAGHSHIAAIRSDGGLFAWGLGTSGELGNSATTSISSPVQLGTSSWVAVAAGKNNTFAVRSGGSLFAWGNNNSVGMLGQNNQVNQSSPVQIGTSSWTSVSAGDNSAAAIRSDNTLWGWGGSDAGQLGYNSSAPRSSPVQVGNNILLSILSPTQVGTSSWIQVASTPQLTFAIRSDNTLWSWGRGDADLLRGSVTTVNSSPVQVGTSSWTFISAQQDDIAGISPDNTAYVWGANSNGQLGQNNRVHRSQPVQIGPTAGVSKVCVAGRDGEAAFYYLTNTGGLFSVGSNIVGKLGLNDLVNRSSPVQVGTSSWINIPGSIGTGLNTDYMFAIRSDNTLWSWGYNGKSNLGINITNEDRSSPVQIGGNDITDFLPYISSPVQVSTSSWSHVTAGANNTFAIRPDGRLFSWGAGGSGQLGTNISTTTQRYPTEIGTSSWIQISTTSSTTGNQAVAAIRSDGGLFAWGLNTIGQLGQNDLINRSSPVQIGTSSWTQVSVGSGHMVGILANKSVYAWGNNANGQLAQNNRDHRSSPVQIGTEQNWLKIDNGQNSILGIKTNNTLWGWGLNTNGEIASAGVDRIHRSSPVQIGTQKDWIQASAGLNTSMAIKNSITKPSVSYITTVGNGTASAVQTFAATSLGVATSNRIIVVATALLGAAGSDDVASVTIAGITATKAGSSRTGGVGASIWYALVPTGETGTIVINLSGSFSVTAHVYALYNANSITPYSTANNGVTSTNITSSAYNTIINAVTIVVANTGAADTITFSSTGSGAITEGYDGFIVSSATRSTATAYIISTSNSSNITLTAQGVANTDRKMVVATWL